MEEYKYLSEDERAYFEFLDRLRSSGATNMFGATPYLTGAFKITPNEGTTILSKWMETFEERGCPGRED